MNLKDKELQDWLETRDWLHHYSGDGEHFFANFSAHKDITNVNKCEATGFPRYGDDYEAVAIDKESSATYTMPIVHLQICGQGNFPYTVKVHFCHLRTGDDYEQVFSGYVTNKEELISVFRLLGLSERHLGCTQK